MVCDISSHTQRPHHQPVLPKMRRHIVTNAETEEIQEEDFILLMNSLVSLLRSGKGTGLDSPLDGEKYFLRKTHKLSHTCTYTSTNSEVHLESKMVRLSSFFPNSFDTTC